MGSKTHNASTATSTTIPQGPKTNKRLSSSEQFVELEQEYRRLKDIRVTLEQRYCELQAEFTRLQQFQLNLNSIASPESTASIIAEPILNSEQNNLSDTDSLKSPIRVAELYAGSGAGRIALEAITQTFPVQFNYVFTSEKNQFARKCYATNFLDGDTQNPSFNEDITQIKKENFARVIPDFDLLIAGFPCQSFSKANPKRQGIHDNKNGMHPQIVLDLINAKKPSLIILENVKGIKSMPGPSEEISLPAYIVQQLISAGYLVQSSILESHHFGVAQNRERWYLVAVRQDSQYALKFASFNFPQGEADALTLFDIISMEESANAPSESIKKAIMLNSMHIANAQDDTPKKIAEYSIAGTTYFLRYNGVGILLRNQDKEKLINYATRQRSVSVFNKYPTLVSSGGLKTPLLELGRVLSINEMKKLQGFPCWYTLPQGTTSQKALSLFGNSFTVPVIQAVATALLGCHPDWPKANEVPSKPKTQATTRTSSPKPSDIRTLKETIDKAAAYRSESSAFRLVKPTNLFNKLAGRCPAEQHQPLDPDKKPSVLRRLYSFYKASPTSTTTDCKHPSCENLTF